MSNINTTDHVPHTNRRNHLFLVLGFFFITNVIVAEFIGTKIFSLEKSLGWTPVQWNIFGDLFNLDMTAGVMLWPFVFILTDIINEYFGPKGVKRLSFLAAIMLVYSFVMIRFSMNLSGSDFWLRGGRIAGIQDMDNAYNAVFGQGLMIIIGSLVAFLVGQILDAIIFDRIKKVTQNKFIWLRATGSTLVSQLIDSYIVLIIAFYLSGTYSLKWVLQVGSLNYLFKLSMSFILLPLLYVIHFYIDRYLGIKRTT